MKSWLQDNDIEMHSTHNKRKSVAADRTKFVSIWRQYLKMLLTYVISGDLNGEKIVVTFYEKELLKQIKKNLE